MLCFTLSVTAQPDYDFTNSIQVSGTGNPSNVQVGDVYRFLNVKPNVDALVTIVDITGGISVSSLDAGSGYPEALQPTLEVPPMTSGYLEMFFQFIDASTDIPLMMLEVPVTCIDVDGLKDNDGLGIDYPGRDTSARQVMFTIVNANVAAFTIRVGADNQSTKAGTRLRSVYFKKFKYANGLLAVSPLQTFTGSVKQDGAHLQWAFQPGYQMKSAVLERSYTGQQFTAIYNEDGLPTNNYVDGDQSNGTAYYRLKWTKSSGEVGYSSTVFLKFPGKNTASDGFKLYPNLVQDRTTVNMICAKPENATLQIYDMNGRMQQQVALKLNSGQNSIAVDGMDKLTPGGYVAVLRSGGNTFTQKMIKQP